MRATVLVLVLAGCVDIASEHRCVIDEDCGTNGRCEPSKNCSFPDPGCGTGGRRYHERAGDGRAKICVLGAQGPSTLSPVELETDIQTGCPTTTSGAKGAMFEVSTDDDQIIVFDTAGTGTSAPTRMALHEGSCPPSGKRLGDCAAPDCPNATGYTRLVTFVESGNHCLVVEEVDPSATTAVALRVLPSHRRSFSTFMPGVQFGPMNSCTGQENAASPTCGTPDVPETAFLFALCPAQTAMLSVNVESATFPVIASLHEAVPQAPAAACSNTPGPGPEMFGGQIMGPGPFWVVVEGVAPMPCGDFVGRIDVTITSP